MSEAERVLDKEECMVGEAFWRVGTVLSSPRATCSSVVIAVRKGSGFRMVTNYGAVNKVVEQVLCALQRMCFVRVHDVVMRAKDEELGYSLEAFMATLMGHGLFAVERKAVFFRDEIK